MMIGKVYSLLIFRTDAFAGVPASSKRPEVMRRASLLLPVRISQTPVRAELHPLGNVGPQGLKRHPDKLDEKMMVWFLISENWLAVHENQSPRSFIPRRRANGLCTALLQIN